MPRREREAKESEDMKCVCAKEDARVKKGAGMGRD